MILVLIGLGLAIYVYGLAVCKGALLASIGKKQIALSLFFSAIWQILVLFIGNSFAMAMHSSNITESEYPINAFIGIIIFAVIALRMFWLAYKNEPIIEKRLMDKEFYKVLTAICLAVGFYTLLTGLALGLLQISLLAELLVLGLLSAVGVLAGLFVGYRYGYGQRTGAYILGGICLIISDVLLFIKYIIA